MRKLLSIMLLSGLFLTVYAMDGQIERINSIKKSHDYLYGEATMQTLADAASLAYEQLQKEVIEWSQQEGVKLSIVTAADINQQSDTIITRRAEMYRVFAFVRKDSLMPKHTIVAEDTIPTVVEKNDSLITDSVKRIIRQRFFGKRENDALYRIKKAKNFFELKEIMQPLKEEGKIDDFGKYASAQHPEHCYLIIYDPAGNICAFLGKGDKERTNLKTGRADSIQNYRGCGAIWFTLHEN